MTNTDKIKGIICKVLDNWLFTYNVNAYGIYLQIEGFEVRFNATEEKVERGVIWHFRADGIDGPIYLPSNLMDAMQSLCVTFVDNSNALINKMAIERVCFEKLLPMLSAITYLLKGFRLSKGDNIFLKEKKFISIAEELGYTAVEKKSVIGDDYIMLNINGAKWKIILRHDKVSAELLGWENTISLPYDELHSLFVDVPVKNLRTFILELAAYTFGLITLQEDINKDIS